MPYCPIEKSQKDKISTPLTHIYMTVHFSLIYSIEHMKLIMAPDGQTRITKHYMEKKKHLTKNRC